VRADEKTDWLPRICEVYPRQRREEHKGQSLHSADESDYPRTTAPQLKPGNESAHVHIQHASGEIRT
jgi:hypothetical protein